MSVRRYDAVVVISLFDLQFLFPDAATSSSRGSGDGRSSELKSELDETSSQLQFKVSMLSCACKLCDCYCMLVHFVPPLPSNRHHPSSGDCLEGKGENYQVCSMQYCVQQLCTVRCTHI